MASRTDQGQVISETLWAILLIAAVVTAVCRVYEASEKMQRQDRWEIQHRRRR